MSQIGIGKRQLRSFGLIVAAGFTVIALWPVAFRGQGPRNGALILALVLAAAGLIAPTILRPFFRVWMTVGEVLGWVNTRIILSVLYYVMIVPIGVLFRMAGNDPMRRKFESNVETYRNPRSKRPGSHMRRQY